MTDTVVIRVHDLRKHEQLVKYVNMNFQGTSKHTAILPKNAADEYLMPAVDQVTAIDYFKSNRIGTHLIKYRRQKKVNNSGNYYFQALENRERDFMEFSFAIPKYIFGTNIFQFVTHPWDPSFVFSQNRSLKFNMSKGHDQLIRFISKFFSVEFINVPIDFQEVEINRIDMCYNQFFPSKESALEYLEYQKQIRKKHIRVNGNSSRDWDTSLMYITKRYSMKIYHKGSEFRKNDKNELLKINREKGSDYFNVDQLESMADRILRYEITFRQKMLSDLFNTILFRKNCPSHRQYMKVYKKVDLEKQRNDRIATRIGQFKCEKSKSKYVEANPYYMPTNDEKKIHKHVSKLISKTRTFVLKSNSNISTFNSTTSNYGYFEPKAKFSNKLYGELSKLFIRFIKEYQVKQKPFISAVSSLIDDYNKHHYDKLPKNEMMKFYAILQNSSFEEIKRLNLYSKATYYRYKKRFELIGITENNVMPFLFANASTDFSEYHSIPGLRTLIKF